MKTIQNKPAQLALLIAVIANALIASAAEPPPCQSGTSVPRQHREPPPEAYQDCKGKQAGDVVQITTPREGKVSATCTNSPKGLFARPEHPPRDRDNAEKNPDK